MAQATAEIIGLGIFEINTKLNEVKVAGSKPTDGTPVKWKIAKVRRNIKAAKAALENRPFSLQECNGIFILEDGQTEE